MDLTSLLGNPHFSVFELTAALNRFPAIPGLVGSMNLFSPRPQTQTVVMIEQQNGTLALIPSAPRGAPAAINVEGNRQMIPMLIPHFPIRDTIMADSILGVRAFGSTSEVEGMASVVNARLASMGLKEDVTQEYLRLGAVKGIVITNVDRTTGIPQSAINLFDAFGVTAQTDINWPIVYGRPITEADAWSAPIRGLSSSLAHKIGAELGGQSFTGMVAICGASFFNAIAGAPETRQVYLYGGNSQQLLNNPYGQRLNYAGITYVEYIGGVGNLVFVPEDTAYVFPTGVPDLFIEAYAPADYIETVNTLALPRYAKQQVMDFDKGVMLECQMNVLPICTRPRALFTLKATAVP